MKNMSDFVLLVEQEDFDELDSAIKRFSDHVEIVKEYLAETDNNKYRILQLEVILSGRSGKDICRFVYNYFPFVVMRQEGSTYLFVPDGSKFKNMTNKLYTKKTKYNFLYDMLTINDRYAACIGAGVDDNSVSNARLIYETNGNIYSLILNAQCIYLFSPNPEIKVSQPTTGEEQDINIIEGLDVFNFHIAILR